MIGKPGAGRVPGARPLQRPGRPHDGHLGEDARVVPRRARRASSASTSPRKHGLDTVDAIRAMRDGRASVFIAMGGNFVVGHPRHRRHRGGAAQTARSPCRSRPSSTARTSSPGAPALILPSLGRTDKDVAGGRQASSSPSRTRCRSVHRSRGGSDAGQRPPAQRGRDRVRAGAGARSVASTSGAVGGVRRRLRPHPRQHLARRSRLRRLQRAGAPARRLRPAAPAARRAPVRHGQRQGQLRRQRAATGCQCPPVG